MSNSTQPQPSVVRRFITPPIFPDEDKTRTARLLHAITMLLWPIYGAAIVITLIQSDDKLSSMVLNAILVATLALTTYLLRSGRVRQASVLFIILQWSIVMGAVIAFGGLSSPTLSGLLLMTVIAGLLVGGRGAIITALATIAALTLMLLAESAGAMPPPIAPTTPLTLYINVSLFLLLAAGLLYITTSSIDRALTTTRRTSAALQQTNRELNSMRTSLEERIIERTEQLNVSAEVARAVSSILDPDELLQRVTLLIVERFNLYYAAAFLVDDDAEFAVLREATGEAGRVLKERGHKLEITGPSMVGTAIATRRPRLAQDVDAETMRFANPLLTETKSEVALPLIIGDQAIGALDVQSTRATAFDESTVLMLQGLADQIAIAINNARQYQAAQLDARQAGLLFEASQAAGFMGQGLEFAINRLFSVLAQRSDFDTWMMATYNHDSQAYTVVQAFDANEPAPPEEVGQVISLDREQDTPTALVIRSNRMIVINDPLNDPLLTQLADDVRSTIGKLIAVPIILGDHLLGVITLGRTVDKPNMGPRDIQLAQALASQMAVAIENGRLLEQSHKSVEEMNRLMRLYMHEGWSNFSQSRGTDRLRQEYLRPDAPLLKPEVLDQIDEAVSHATATSDVKPINVDGQSVVSVPIELRGEVFGALTMQDTSDRQWTNDELATLQAVAAQVAQSLEAARLLQDSEVSLQETMGLYQASRGIAAAQTPAEVLQSISDTIVIVPEIDRIILALVIPDSPKDNLTAEVAAAWERGVDAPAVIGHRWKAAQIPLIGPRLIEPLVANDVATAANLDPISRHIFANVNQVKSLAVLPLQAGGGLLGWLMIETLRQNYNFGEAEIRRYRTLAGQAAVALENRRLFHDVQDRVNQLTILTRIGRRLASTLDLNEILASVIEESFNATDATHGGIFLYNERENALELRVMRGFSPEMENQYAGYIMHESEGLIGRVLSTGEALLINDVTQEPGYQMVDAGTRAELIMPIRQGGLLLGVLNLESPQVNAFSESDQRLLEAMADQAAVAITNARAYEAERQAVERMREVDRLKTQFLANMSHELRTPLNAILGFSELMARDTGLTMEQQYNLATINRSGEHLLNLINDVLDMAKIETGRAVVNFRQFDMHRLLDELTDLFRLRATEKGLTLLLTRDPSVPQLLETDDKKLRQILLNLLSNAVKFTDRGGVGLRVKFADGLLWCEVQDTGPGISPQELETIFEPFVQTTYGLKSKEGTGLGLAISRQFAQLLGGSLVAFSTGESGQGALFMLQLPVGVPLASTLPAVATDSRLTVAGLEPNQLIYRILVAEDRLENSELLRLLLAKLGFEVRVAANGLEAINVWREWQPHLILMDMRMPVLDGHEATRRIKATALGQATIIVALTAGAFDDEREQVRLDGCDDFLSKPFHPNDVAELLTKHLGVRFIYRSGTGPLVPPTTRLESVRSPIDSAQLAQLPAAWRQQAALAARAADADQLMTLIAQIRSAQPFLAAALSDLTFNFEYDAILQALTAHGENE